MSPRPRMPVGGHGEISAHRLATGQWQARVYVRDPDGRRRQVAAHGRTKARAVNALQERLLTRRPPGGGDALNAGTTVAELSRLWLTEHTGSINGTSRDLYQRATDRYVVPLLGDLLLSELTVSRIEGALAAVAKKSKAGTGGPVIAQTTRSVLVMMLDLAVRHDAIATNPARAASRPKAGGRARPEVVALTVEEVHAFRGHLRSWAEAPSRGPKRNPALVDLFDVLLGTGCRPGEVLGLRWCDVDLPARTVTVAGTVVRTHEAGLHRQGYPKTATSARTVAVPLFAVEALQRRAAAQGEAAGGDALVFPNRDGGVWDPNNVGRLWRSARGDGKWAEVQLRAARRAVATLIAREAGMEAAQDQLGHSSPEVTRGHYVQRRGSSDYAAALEVLGEE